MLLLFHWKDGQTDLLSHSCSGHPAKGDWQIEDVSGWCPSWHKIHCTACFQLSMNVSVCTVSKIGISTWTCVFLLLCSLLLSQRGGESKFCSWLLELGGSLKCLSPGGKAVSSDVVFSMSPNRKKLFPDQKCSLGGKRLSLKEKRKRNSKETSKNVQESERTNVNKALRRPYFLFETQVWSEKLGSLSH